MNQPLFALCFLLPKEIVFCFSVNMSVKSYDYMSVETVRKMA